MSLGFSFVAFSKIELSENITEKVSKAIIIIFPETFDYFSSHKTDQKMIVRIILETIGKSIVTLSLLLICICEIFEIKTVNDLSKIAALNSKRKYFIFLNIALVLMIIILIKYYIIDDIQLEQNWYFSDPELYPNIQTIFGAFLLIPIMNIFLGLYLFKKKLKSNISLFHYENNQIKRLVISLIILIPLLCFTISFLVHFIAIGGYLGIILCIALIYFFLSFRTIICV